MVCSKCGKEIMNGADFCPGCGCMVEDCPGDKKYEDDEEYEGYEDYEYDKISVGLCILSVLIPLFGIIYWAFERERPRRTRACLTASLISWGIGILLHLLS